MNLQHLPQDDQPDTYAGTHTNTRVRWTSADLTHGVYHLCIHTSDDEYQQRRGTYCTRFNPVHTFDIGNTRTVNAAGESLYYPREGATAGHLIAQQPLYGYQGAHLTPCPDCLTLAAVQAEMRGQNTYPVVTLCQQLQRLPDHQPGAPGSSSPAG